MELVFIAAEERQGGDGHLRYAQIELGVSDPGADNILDAGHAEKLFI